MTYSKPTVEKLGDAADIVQVVSKPNRTINDAALTGLSHPAYDLDE